MLALGGYVSSGRMGMEMFPSTGWNPTMRTAPTTPTVRDGGRPGLRALEKHLVNTAKEVIRENGGKPNWPRGVLSTVSVQNAVTSPASYLTSPPT